MKEEEEEEKERGSVKVLNTVTLPQSIMCVSVSVC